MNKKEKIGVAKSGVAAYLVCSTIGYFKEGGIRFINRADSWSFQIKKSLGVIDVFRMKGSLAHLDLFGHDWALVWFGLGTSLVAMIVVKLIYWFESTAKEEVKATPHGYKVKFHHDEDE